MLIIKSN